MESKLHYNPTSQQLLSILKIPMAAKEFNAFRLVGGIIQDIIQIDGLNWLLWKKLLP